MSGSSPQNLLAWQLAILGSDLPTTTRHLLLTLSVRMNWKDFTCYPSLDILEIDTGLARSTICQHLTMASSAGWIIIEKRRGTGQKWRLNLYRARIPHDGLSKDEGGSSTELSHKEKVVREKTGASPSHTQFVDRPADSNYSINESRNSAGADARDENAAPSPAEEGNNTSAHSHTISTSSIGPSDLRAWEEVRRHIATELGEATFRSWFLNIKLEATSPSFVLSAPTGYIRDWLISHHGWFIDEMLGKIFKSEQPVEWRVRPKNTGSVPSSQQKERTPARTLPEGERNDD